MTNSSSSSTSSSTSGGSVGSPTPPVSVTPSAKPITQEARKNFRQYWPAWMQQLPRFRFPAPNPQFELLDRAQLTATLKDSDPIVIKRIFDDLDFMEHEVMRLFRDRDYEASVQQNRYRLYQIGYILLSTAATLIGSLQALALNGSAHIVPFLAFGETVVALIATFLATISGREPPFTLWMANRRRAETLRREYFRFLMNLPPYDTLEGYHRRMALSERAADINRGVFPTDEEQGN